MSDNTTHAENDWEAASKELRKQLADKAQLQVCPHCGYCPTCGRRNGSYWTYPVIPWYQPYYPSYPYTICCGTTSGGTGVITTGTCNHTLNG